MPKFNMFWKFAHRAPALLAVGLALLSVIMGPARAQHMTPTPVMSAYFKMLFVGDLSGAPQLFDDNPDDPMTGRIKGQFESRFVDRTNGLDLTALKSEKAKTVVALYQAYWRDTLMRVASPVEREAALIDQLDLILLAEGYESAGDDEDKREEQLESFLRAEGVYAQSGRTPPLQDLMIWTENRISTERITLTDGVYDVDVNFLDGFVSHGWMSFASFGMTSAGGWAKKDGLYCVCGAYDMSSERYQLSFLKHEARHYVDFKLYPELKAADLEYRGKLTELAFAEAGLYAQLAQFTNGANKIDNAPHPLANWHVVDGLSRLVLDGNTPTDASAWEAVAKDDIRNAARQLLDEHDAALKREGAETTEGVITA